MERMERIVCWRSSRWTRWQRDKKRPKAAESGAGESGSDDPTWTGVEVAEAVEVEEAGLVARKEVQVAQWWW